MCFKKKFYLIDEKIKISTEKEQKNILKRFFLSKYSNMIVKNREFVSCLAFWMLYKMQSIIIQAMKNQITLINKVIPVFFN